MNIKETLKKLHTEFPEFDLDTLFKIIDCYVLESAETKQHTKYLNLGDWNIGTKPQFSYYTNDDINEPSCHCKYK